MLNRKQLACRSPYPLHHSTSRHSSLGHWPRDQALYLHLKTRYFHLPRQTSASFSVSVKIIVAVSSLENPTKRAAASNYLRKAGETHGTVEIQISIGDGKGSGLAWGCDLSYDYVKINAEYTT